MLKPSKGTHLNRHQLSRVLKSCMETGNAFLALTLAFHSNISERPRSEIWTRFKVMKCPRTSDGDKELNYT